MFDYPVVLKARPEGGFLATFADVPEAIAPGEDEGKALRRAVDALETALRFMSTRRHPAPRRRAP